MKKYCPYVILAFAIIICLVAFIIQIEDTRDTTKHETKAVGDTIDTGTSTTTEMLETPEVTAPEVTAPEVTTAMPEVTDTSGEFI